MAFAYSAIDKCKTDVYFGNGVWNMPKKEKQVNKYRHSIRLK